MKLHFIELKKNNFNILLFKLLKYNNYKYNLIKFLTYIKIKEFI